MDRTQIYHVYYYRLLAGLCDFFIYFFIPSRFLSLSLYLSICLPKITRFGRNQRSYIWYNYKENVAIDRELTESNVK